MRIAVFGATGGTGQYIVREALAQDHQVTAVVRNPRKLNLDHPNLSVTTTSVNDLSSLATVLADHDAGASAFGANRLREFRGPRCARRDRRCHEGPAKNSLARVSSRIHRACI